MVPLYSIAAVQANVWPVAARRGAPPEPAHRQRNLDRAVELIRRAAETAPARIWVLPEFFLSGAPGAGAPGGAEHVCIRIPGPEIDVLCRLAREVDGYIAGAVWEVMDDWPGRYWNTAFILSPDGEIILRYHKHYDLTGKTRPGDVLEEYVARYGLDALFPVVDTPLGRLACLTCYDINFPEVARCLALNGAEVLLHPTAEGRAAFLREDEGGWDLCRRSRAWENLCYVVSANGGHHLGSDFPEDTLRGRSQIVDFNGQVMAIAATPGEAIVRADIELARLRERRGRLHMNFLAQLQTQVHAPFYERAERWPSCLFSAAPPASGDDNNRAGEAVIARLQAAGAFVRPAD
jgi:predicted amidohydrolase